MYSSYASALGEGSMYSAKNEGFNEQVQAHNQLLDDTYKHTLLTQKGTIASDKQKEELTGATDGAVDGASLIGSVVGVGKTYKEMQGKTVGEYLSQAKNERLNTIGTTWEKFRKGEPLPKAGGPTASVTSDGKVTEATASETTKPMTQPRASVARKAIGVDEETWNEATGPEQDLLTKHFGGPPSSGPGAVGETPTSTAVAGAEAGEETTGAVASAGGEIESSGIVPGLIKSTLMAGGAGKIASEAAISGVSEIGGKVASSFVGVTDAIKGFDNLGHGKNFFGDDDTAHKWGDSFQMAGSVADLAGTAFPPLEVLGGILNLTGGLVDGIDDLLTDNRNTQKDATHIAPPKHTATKVSPAYGALGLIASAPISAKTSIVGSGGF
jgi:hypothetical protein